MKRFDRYFQRKMKDPVFKALYEEECHVCAKTMQIFAKTQQENIALVHLADLMGVTVDRLEALRDADECDPELVVRLCRHLGLAVPESCPRRDNH